MPLIQGIFGTPHYPRLRVKSSGLSPNITQVTEKQHLSAKGETGLSLCGQKKLIAALAHMFDARMSAPAGATKTLTEHAVRC